MTRIIQRLMLSAAMLTASTLVMAGSDKDARHDNKQCEAQVEAAEEACEAKAQNPGDVQLCKAQAEQAKEMCKEAENDRDRDKDRDRDRDHR